MTHPALLLSTGFHNSERQQAAALFWEAFGAKLGKIMAPAPKATAFFAQTLDPDYCICARTPQGTLLGLAGFKTSDGAFSGGGLARMAQHYGWWHTLLRAPVLAALERKLTPDELLMDGIFVTQEARGRGVGSALLTAIKQTAVTRGYKRLRLDVIDTNPRARALYERQGFVAGEAHSAWPLRRMLGFSYATTMIWTPPESADTTGLAG